MPIQNCLAMPRERKCAIYTGGKIGCGALMITIPIIEIIAESALRRSICQYGVSSGNKSSIFIITLLITGLIAEISAIIGFTVFHILSERASH